MGGLPIYDRSALARRDVVAVTINYRLGAFGFFNHPGLDRETPGGPANFGLLDQIAALRWVRSKVEETGVALAVAGAQASAASLRSVSADQLAERGEKISLAPGFIVGDNAVLVPLLEAFQKGREHPVPLIIGNNSADTSVVETFGVDLAVLVQKMGKAHIVVRSLYPGVSDQSQLGREVARDTLFTAFGRRIAYLHSAKAPTWRYYFNHVSPNPSTGANTKATASVTHGSEVPFVLGTLERRQCLGRPVTPQLRLCLGLHLRKDLLFIRTGLDREAVQGNGVLETRA